MKLLALPLLLSLISFGTTQAPPRDARRPASEPDSKERTVIDAAAANPTSAAAQQSVAVFYYEAGRIADSPELQLSYALKGIAAADRALAINPDYLEAMIYKNILLRRQANLLTDRLEQIRLIDQADALRARVLAIQRGSTARATPPPPQTPFAGFDEPFDQAMARLQPVRVGGNLRVPTKTKDVKPAFPADAQAARTQGVVILEAIVGDDGKIVNARVVRSIPALDAAALDAVSQWEFTPTLLNGAPVAVLMTVTVNFTLQ